MPIDTPAPIPYQRAALTLTRLDGDPLYISDASELDLAAAAAAQRDGETLTIEYFPEVQS